MYLHQDIIVVIRRYLNLLERAVMALQVFKITLLLDHHGLPDIQVKITKNLRLYWDSKFRETFQGITPMYLADLEAIALGRGLVDEHGSSVERYVMRSNYELISKAQLEQLFLVNLKPKVNATTLVENDLVDKV